MSRARTSKNHCLSAVLQVHGEDADGLEPLLFLGSSGHGVVCSERGDDATREPARRRLRLVRLVKPAPLPLQRMVLDRAPLKIPASELDRFAEELCPGAAQRRRGRVVGRLLRPA